MQSSLASQGAISNLIVFLRSLGDNQSLQNKTQAFPIIAKLSAFGHASDVTCIVHVDIWDCMISCH